MGKLNRRGLSLSSSEGFTLIEVVLVLAIGGLIFLLAFLAFRQVTVNRRDTQRRADAARIIVELQNYYTNNYKDPDLFPTPGSPGLAASATCDPDETSPFMLFLTTYMCKDGEFKSPSGDNYSTRRYNHALLDSGGTDMIRYINKATCNADYPGGPTVLGSVRVDIGLENGSWVCRDLKTQ